MLFSLLGLLEENQTNHFNAFISKMYRINASTHNGNKCKITKPNPVYNVSNRRLIRFNSGLKSCGLDLGVHGVL